MTGAEMARHVLTGLVLSLLGGMLGSFAASLLSFWLYPQRQSGLAMFLHDLFSLGGVASAAFVWMFYVPALIGLLLLNKRLIRGCKRDFLYVVFFVVSFLLMLISQLYPFASFSNGVLDYFLNALLVELVMLAVMAGIRSRGKAER
jgi:hypothetical protein